MEVLSLESVDSTETCEEGSTVLNLYSLNVRFTGSKREKGVDLERQRRIGRNNVDR